MANPATCRRQRAKISALGVHQTSRRTAGRDVGGHEGSDSSPLLTSRVAAMALSRAHSARRQRRRILALLRRRRPLGIVAFLARDGVPSNRNRQ